MWHPNSLVPPRPGVAPDNWIIPLRDFRPEDHLGMEVVIHDVDGVRWAQVSRGMGPAQPPGAQLAEALPAAPVHPRLPVLHIITLAEWQEVPGAYTVINCKVLRDPASQNLRIHPGSHPGIVDSIVGHAEFPTILAQVKALTRRWQTADSPQVALQCKSGKHRSVAVSILLQYLLQDEFDVRVQHYNFANWGRHAQGCMQGQCSDCLQQPTLLDEARRQWLSAAG